MHPGSSPIGANIRRFGAPRPSWPGQAAWALLCHDRAMRKSIFNHRCTLIHTDDIGSTNARFAALRMAPDYICVHQCASVVEIACFAQRMPAYPERYVSAYGIKSGAGCRVRRCFGAAPKPRPTRLISSRGLSKLSSRPGRGSVIICVFGLNLLYYLREIPSCAMLPLRGGGWVESRRCTEQFWRCLVAANSRAKSDLIAMLSLSRAGFVRPLH
jgi:hypothetical protein